MIAATNGDFLLISEGKLSQLYHLVSGYYIPH